MTRTSASFLVPLVLLSCNSSSTSETPIGATNAAPTGVSSSELTWHRDIRPIVEQKCATCHQPGSFAPLSFQNYSEVFANRVAIATAVHYRSMPPWLASPTCNTYQHNRSLTDAEQSSIVSWAGGNALEGDASTYVAPSVAPPPKLRVDKNLKMSSAYTPTISPDEYRCFVMDWNESKTKYVTGITMKPGAVNEVHHVIAFLIPPSELDKVEALEKADSAPGYSCFGGVGIDRAEWLGAWAPGALSGPFPAQSGLEVPAGSKIVLQLHYNTAASSPSPDQTSVEFQLDDQVSTKASVLKLANPLWPSKKTMRIKAGDADSVQSYSIDLSPYLSNISGGILPSNQPIQLHSAALHMHSRGVKASLQVTHADGSRECALQIDNWDFHWQGSYFLQTPITYRPGDKISIECHFDNSGARQPVVNGKALPVTDVNWGESTEDEMCLGVFYATP